jgi:hypothetical protein
MPVNTERTGEGNVARKKRGIKTDGVEKAESAIAEISKEQEGSLLKLREYISGLGEGREEAIELASDAIALLADPEAFEEEIFARAAAKIRANKRPGGRNLQQKYRGIAACYEDFEVPNTGLAPITIAGCLPM